MEKHFQLKGGGSKTPDSDWTRGGGRSRAGSRANSPPKSSDVLPAAPRSRRASRVSRQHSYDDEVKAALLPGGGGSGGVEGGLGLPAPMPRRASAYDVFSGKLKIFFGFSCNFLIILINFSSQFFWSN